MASLTEQTSLDRSKLADDAPVSEIRGGLILLGLLTSVLLALGSFITLDAAVVAQGRLIVAGQRQAVQHPTGGMIYKVHVRDGDVMAAGSPLIEFVGTEERQTELGLASQLLSLEAQKARLVAELSEQATIRWPALLKSPQPEYAEIAQTSMALQSSEFLASRSGLAAKLGAFRKQEQRAREGAVGYDEQIAAASEQVRLLNEELDALAPVAEKGFVSRSRLRVLERARAELLGREGEYRANAAQANTSAAESRIRRVEAEQGQRQGLAEKLRDVERLLADIHPRFTIARERRNKLIVRAPQAGTVVGLSVFNAGSIAAAGQRLLDIVPTRAKLEIQAEVPLENGDDLQIGQIVEVKFSGIQDRGLPVLRGRLATFSADAFVDTVRDSSYYLATIELQPDQINVIRSVRGPRFQLRPGAPVTVVLPTRGRTALDYAFEPLVDAVWRSFREE